MLLIGILAAACAIGCQTVSPGARSQDPASAGVRGVASGLEKPSLARSDRGADWLAAGDAQRRAGAYGAAHASYLRAHLARRTDLTPLQRIAYLALRTDVERSEALFRELLLEEPEAPGLELGLGYALMAQGKWGDAQKHLERAVQVSPDSVATRSALAIVVGHSADADGLDGVDATAESLNNRGLSRMVAGDWVGAVSLLEAALGREPDRALFSNNLGLALGLAGRNEEALLAFRAHGSEGDALNNLGWVRSLRGDYPQARDLFEQALLSNDTDEIRVLRNLERLDALESAPVSH